MVDKTDNATKKSREKRKRRRPAVSCNQCRRRKIGCDKKSPCNPCIHNGTSCEYTNGGDPFHSTASIPGQHIIDINSWSSQTLDNASAVDTPKSAISTVGQEQDVITERGHSFDINPNPAPSRLNGRFEKSRLFGQSHWMSNKIEFPNLVVWSRLFYDESGAVQPLLAECKQLARKLKSKTLARSAVGHVDFREFLPCKEVCDGLVESYLNTFESIFRIFHVPTFRKDYEKYWVHPYNASDSFLVKLLLVAAIGACFYNDIYHIRPPLHSQSSDWVYAVQAWMKVPFAKQCMNIHGVQIHCLLVLALQVTSVGGDLSWIAAGSLVRTAMTIGLHRDPVHFPKMSVLQAEIRRRLWATTLEIATQTSLDAGMPPLVSWKDFDCSWPSNINDEEISEETSIAPVSKPDDVFTQNSIQCALTRSISFRLKIAKLLNNLHSQFSHEDAVSIGNELNNACCLNLRLFSTLIQATNSSQLRPTSFQVKMLDILSRRFLFSLHMPFARKAFTDVAFYYSRKVCIESALLLLSSSLLPLRPISIAAEEDLYMKLRIHGRGIFRGIIIQASAQTAMELVATLREDPAAPTSSLVWNELYQAIAETMDIARRRFDAGETNVKMYVCLSCVLGQIRALKTGYPSAAQALEMARQDSLRWCLEVLKERVAAADAELPRNRDRKEANFTTSSDTADTKANLPWDASADLLWDSNLVTVDWSNLLPPEWENEGWFFDEEL